MIKTMYIKVLQGDDFKIETDDNISVKKLKSLVSDYLNKPEEQIKLLYKGKPLADDKNVVDYSKEQMVRLILVTKKDDSPLSTSMEKTTVLRDAMRAFFLQYYVVNDAEKILHEFMKEFYNLMSSLSLEDFERIATSYLAEEEKQENKV